MSRNTQFYSQASHSVNVAGRPLEDYFEGNDVIAFEPEGSSFTLSRGLDQNKPSIGSRRPGILTVRLKPTSPSVDYLDELVRNQENGNAIVFNVTVVTGVNDVLTLRDSVIEKQGYTTGGPEMQARVYRFGGSTFEQRS